MSFRNYSQYLNTGNSQIDRIAKELIQLGIKHESNPNLTNQVILKATELDRALQRASIDPAKRAGLQQLAKKGKYIRRGSGTTADRPDVDIADFSVIIPTGSQAMDELIQQIIDLKNSNESTQVTEELNRLEKMMENEQLSDSKRAELLEFLAYLKTTTS